MAIIDSQLTGITATLTKCNIFSSIAEKECALLAHAAQVINLTKNAILYREAHEADGVYVIQSGLVGIFDKQNHLLDTYQPLTCIGAYALSGVPFPPVCARALQPARLILIPRESLHALCARIPGIALCLLQATAIQTKRLLNIVNILKGRQIEASVAAWLLDQLKEPYYGSADGKTVNLAIKKNQLAEILNTRRETLSRVFKAFCEQQIIEMQKGNIRILNYEKLHAAANCEE